MTTGTDKGIDFTAADFSEDLLGRGVKHIQKVESDEIIQTMFAEDTDAKQGREDYGDFL